MASDAVDQLLENKVASALNDPSNPDNPANSGEQLPKDSSFGANGKNLASQVEIPENEGDNSEQELHVKSSNAEVIEKS